MEIKEVAELAYRIELKRMEAEYDAAEAAYIQAKMNILKDNARILEVWGVPLSVFAKDSKYSAGLRYTNEGIGAEITFDLTDSQYDSLRDVVKVRKDAWVEFQDLRTGKQGWIDSFIIKHDPQLAALVTRQ